MNLVKSWPHKIAGTAVVNLLTLSRLAAAVGFLAFILGGEPRLAILMLAGIYVSDILDGLLARKWKVATRFGACFDLVSDIFFVLLSYQALVIAGSLPMWMLPMAMFKFAEFISTSYILSRTKSGGRAAGRLSVTDDLAVAAGTAVSGVVPVADGAGVSGVMPVGDGAGVSGVMPVGDGAPVSGVVPVAGGAGENLQGAAPSDNKVRGRFTPVFDRLGRLSGILYMCVPAPVMLMMKFDSYTDMHVPIAVLSLLICLLATVSSVHRIGKCVLAVRSNDETLKARSSKSVMV